MSHSDPLFLSTAIEAVVRAGHLQIAKFGTGVRVDKKGAIDLVTEVDIEVERMFRALVAERFPDHDVLAEELGDRGARGARHRWVFDPLDGTTNFAHGLALFCVSIALEVDGRVELAVVYDPVAVELFTAERGEGARLNGVPMRVSVRRDLIDALLCTGFPYSIRERQQRQVDVFAGFLGKSRAVRRLGSAALDLCYVAAGRFDGFWEEQLHAWDVAAGVLIVEEAGGRVTGYEDQPHDLFGGHIVASNGPLHGPMLEVIRRTS